MQLGPLEAVALRTQTRDGTREELCTFRQCNGRSVVNCVILCRGRGSRLSCRPLQVGQLQLNQLVAVIDTCCQQGCKEALESGD